MNFLDLHEVALRAIWLDSLVAEGTWQVRESSYGQDEQSAAIWCEPWEGQQVCLRRNAGGGGLDRRASDCVCGYRSVLAAVARGMQVRQ